MVEEGKNPQLVVRDEDALHASWLDLDVDVDLGLRDPPDDGEAPVRHLPRPEEVAKDAEGSFSTQLINDDGKLVASSLNEFSQSVKLPDCGISYAVVAIMGPQSSGKSTLLNALFSTKFDMMKGEKGREQTTKGVWMAKATDIVPLTIVLDIEGSDGKERGEDNLLERQTSLLALALADVVMINIWCIEIGRLSGVHRMLKTVFQVMTQLFSPSRTTLLFIIRDKTRSPLEHLEANLRQDIEMLWNEVKKPEQCKNATLSDFFIVQVTALTNFEEKETEFREQVAQLRERFYNSIAPGGLAGDRHGRVPGSGFSLSVENIWKSIIDNNDLDLPTQKVMVATIKCDMIADEKFMHLSLDEDWLALSIAAKSGTIPEFGQKISTILAAYLSQYDKEAMYYEGSVYNAKRQQLETKMLQFVHPTHLILQDHILSQAKKCFRAELDIALRGGEGFAASVRNLKESCMLEFDNQCKDLDVLQAPHWDTREIRENLTSDIAEYSSLLQNKMLTEIKTSCKEKLTETIKDAYIDQMLVESYGGGSWHFIRQILNRATRTAVSDFEVLVSGFELDGSRVDQMLQSLVYYTRGLVEKTAKQEAAKVITHMKNRFTNAFNMDSDSMPRHWTVEDDIKKITQDSRSLALKILSNMAVIRLEEKPDNIETILFSSLMNLSLDDSIGNNSFDDSLVSGFWEEFSPSDTIITPIECKYKWTQFLEQINATIAQATSVQDANKARAAQEEAMIAERLDAAERAETAAVVARAQSDSIKAHADAAIAIAKSEASATVEIAEANARAEAEAYAAKAEAIASVARAAAETAEAKAAAAAADANLEATRLVAAAEISAASSKAEAAEANARARESIAAAQAEAEVAKVRIDAAMVMEQEKYNAALEKQMAHAAMERERANSAMEIERTRFDAALDKERAVAALERDMERARFEAQLAIERGKADIATQNEELERHRKRGWWFW